MAGWETASWESDVHSGVPRSVRRSGTYQRYLPDLLAGADLAVTTPVSQALAEVERGIRSLNSVSRRGLAGIARFLLRSEAIASSQIEGVAPSPQQVALAELGQSETVKGVSENARLVANNMTVVNEATHRLVATPVLSVDDIVKLHSSLLPDQRHHGLRTVQNWIGASEWSPIGASFVPPPPERVPALMADLVDYINGAAHGPLVQAAIAHAQFETIHPFTDGNGRVGRALIHTVLTRRGLTDRAVLPISLVFATLSDTYVDGLTSYRHSSPAGSNDANAAINVWLNVFREAAATAVEQSRALVDEIADLRADWDARLNTYRSSIGLRSSPRVDSAVTRLLDQLTEAPLLTVGTARRILEVSYPAARDALIELNKAGILQPKKIERGATAYVAPEVLVLITITERALASTQFDTRVSPPHGGTPTLPD